MSTPSYHEELAKHLDAQAHPLPCPKRYDHGYIKYSSIPLPTMPVRPAAPVAGRARVNKAMLMVVGATVLFWVGLVGVAAWVGSVK